MQYELEWLDEKYMIYQSDKLYKFSNDPVWLAKFANVRNCDVCVDFGSGSGIIPILLESMYHPKTIYGIEIQREMQEMSLASIEKNKIENIKIFNDKIQNASKLIPCKVDVVTTNPPYFKMQSKAVPREMCHAIARNEVEINLEELVLSAKKIIKTKGRFFICYTTSRVAELIATLHDNDFGIKRLKFISAKNKPSHLVLVEAIYGSNPETVVEKSEEI